MSLESTTKDRINSNPKILIDCDLLEAIDIVKLRPSYIKFFLPRTDINEDIIFDLLCFNLRLYPLIKESRPELITDNVLNKIKTFVSSQVTFNYRGGDKYFLKSMKDKVHYYKMTLDEDLIKDLVERIKDDLLVFDLLE